MSPTRQESVQKIYELIKGIKIASLVTLDDTGALHSRPMVTQEVEFDGDVWFFTSRSTDKVAQALVHPQVNVTYSSDNNFVSLAGRASIVDDLAKKKQLWHEMLKIWFKDGPEDPDVVLIRVEAESAQFWESPSGGLVGAVIGMVRVALTGDADAAGETGQVNL